MDTLDQKKYIGMTGLFIQQWFGMSVLAIIFGLILKATIVNSWIPLKILLVLAFMWGGYFTAYTAKKYKEAKVRLLDYLHNKLPNTDIYSFNALNSVTCLALDIEANKFTYFRCFNDNIIIENELQFNEIKSVTYQNSVAEKWTSFRPNMNQQLQLHTENKKLETEAMKSRGLMFCFTDPLKEPYLVNTSTIHLTKWERVINDLFDDNLEKREQVHEI